MFGIFQRLFGFGQKQEQVIFQQTSQTAIVLSANSDKFLKAVRKQLAKKKPIIVVVFDEKHFTAFFLTSIDSFEWLSRSNYWKPGADVMVAFDPPYSKGVASLELLSPLNKWGEATCFFVGLDEEPCKLGIPSPDGVLEWLIKKTYRNVIVTVNPVIWNLEAQVPVNCCSDVLPEPIFGV